LAQYASIGVRRRKGASMAFLQSAVLSLLLLAACVFTHYEAFRVIAGRMKAVETADRRLVLQVVVIALCAHLIEIAIFALGYFIADVGLDLGNFAGVREASAIDYLYFSIETYTSLGFGDIYPTGVMRLIAGVECLIGLIMIGWSTSFTYLSMRQLWESPAARERL
jgi:hypothetical protein